MGIKHLFSVIKDEAPAAIKEGDIKNQFGRKVAIVCQTHRCSGCRANLNLCRMRMFLSRVVSIVVDY